MAFPAIKTNAVDGPPGIGTPIQAALLNNIETKVGIDNDPNPDSLDYMVRHAVAGSDPLLEIYNSGEALGGNRVVYIADDGSAYYAGTDIPESKNTVVGVTTLASIQGAPNTVRLAGQMTEVSWSWTMDLPLFLSTNGLLTQTPPTTGFSLIIGFPLSATQILISIKQPILLT